MIFEIGSINEYLGAIKEIYAELYPASDKTIGYSFDNGLFYRGHSKADYPLKPSVLREEAVMKAEKTMLLNFRDFMPQYELSYDFVNQRIEILALMQHYDIPTRLMDWTLSPLIALYFAVKVKDKRNHEGAVWVFNPWTYYCKFFTPSKEYPDSHSAHIFARALLSDRNNSPKQENILSKTNERFGVTFDENSLKLPFSFVSSFNNPRILHQRGAFTIHGSSDEDFGIQLYLERDKFLKKIIVKNKEFIYKELSVLFINEFTVYPDFQGMSNKLKEDRSLYKAYFNF